MPVILRPRSTSPCSPLLRQVLTKSKNSFQSQNNHSQTPKFSNSYTEKQNKIYKEMMEPLINSIEFLDKLSIEQVVEVAYFKRLREIYLIDKKHLTHRSIQEKIYNVSSLLSENGHSNEALSVMFLIEDRKWKMKAIKSLFNNCSNSFLDDKFFCKFLARISDIENIENYRELSRIALHLTFKLNLYKAKALAERINPKEKRSKICTTIYDKCLRLKKSDRKDQAYNLLRLHN